MRRRDRFLSVVLVLLLVAGVKFAQQLYHYYAFSEERVELVRLQGLMETEGLGVIGTQLPADSLRLLIEAADEKLESVRGHLDRIERRLSLGASGVRDESTYRDELAGYDALVSARNASFLDWRAIVDSNHAHVDRYNLLADSIRRLATGIGEPYFPIPSPAEIAVRHEAAAPVP